ncbi:MAG: hypothetical protein FWG17_07130 [Desulfovibrionaceae bacterium]|nr:hypothetical protein [Desulfovibrionaceae bacterium]
MASKRKPYIRETRADWWKKNAHYRFYMLREGTAVFTIWVSLLFFILLVSPASFTRLTGNPLVIVINIAALAASILHSKTWFELTPRALTLAADKTANLTRLLWGAAIGFTILVLILSFI